MEIISIIADVCGILGFIISIFAVSKVYSIRKELKNNNNVNDSIPIGFKVVQILH
jgi:hypothetical protein